jgi:hypothetical protein
VAGSTYAIDITSQQTYCIAHDVESMHMIETLSMH